MGFVWRLEIPTQDEPEKTNGSDYTWEDYAQKIAMIVFSSREKAETIVCINDPYDLQFSIKDMERDQRSLL